MPNVHVFTSNGRFKSFEELRAFVDRDYNEDGESIPSQFENEVAITNYEPMAIEAIASEDGTVPIRDLLNGCSYEEQWIMHIDSTITADAALCFYSPNELGNPEGSSLNYLGTYPYET